MKMRATSGYRNSSQVTLRTSLTQSSTTLPIRSTRGTSEGERWSQMVSGASAGFPFDFYHDGDLSVFKEDFNG